MRISGGSAKGRRTATSKLFARASKGEALRPTSAKVREALFDILRNRIEGSAFVDLYAGTGTVGFESLSRGAEKAVFIEPDPDLIEMMRRNARDFGFSEQAEIIRGRADEFLRKAAASHEQYDIYFLDPPYQSEEIEKVLPVIGEEELLKTDGIVVVEHFFKKRLPERVGSLELCKCYRYGDTMLTLYRKVLQ
jgi:16S rRNA (guanine(966)-N(2))-methyltransferase RsmD